MKKNILLIIVVICIVGLDSFMIFSLIKNGDKTKSLNQITNISKQPVAPAEFTGAIKEQVKIDAQTQQASKLTDLLPISTASFAISMDYSHDIFVVIINKPSKQNYGNFQQWIITNGFTEIPPEKFKINYQ